MTNDFNLPERKNLRLKGYDYSNRGLYFITICVQNRECLFGEIIGEALCAHPEMILNDAGRMVEKWFQKLEDKYPDKTIYEMVVMPNHLHGIIENLDEKIVATDAHVGTPLRRRPLQPTTQNESQPYGHNNHVIGATIGRIMDCHIIRDEQEYERISEYIRNNPALWEEDRFR
jgi:putative transposase